jgi:hypothetical protein
MSANAMLAEEFYALVLAELTKQAPDQAAAIQALKADDDLLGSGLVDSYGLINLCLALEARTGAPIDIAVLEPEQFGSMAALFQVVTTSSEGDDAAARAIALKLTG